MPSSDTDIRYQPFDYKTLSFLEWVQRIEDSGLFEGKPVWLKTLLAARADILASYLDARANDNMFHSMYTKQNVFNFAKYLDYDPDTKQCATGQVQVTLNSGTSLPVTIPKAQLVFQTEEIIGDAPAIYSALADKTFTTLTALVDVREGQEFSDIEAYTFLGADFEEFDVTRVGLVKGLVSVVINSLVWTEVDHFFDSIDTDRHFRVMYNYDGTVKIRGGNGVYGMRFPVGYNPRVTAWYGGGTRGNLGIGKISVYSGTSSLVSSVTNIARTSGGSGDESIDHIKLTAPLYVQAQSRAVSENDFVGLSLSYPGIKRVYVQANYYGILSARLQIVPAGGGSASTTLKNNLQTYLKEKTLLSGVFINVDSTDYYPVDIMVEIYVADGYIFDDIYPFALLGVMLVSSECLEELKEQLKSEGIVSAVTYINSLWSFTFNTGDDVSNAVIKTLIEEAEVIDWGGDFYSNAIYSEMDLIEGIDRVVVVNPASYASIPDNYLATYGTISIIEADKPERECSTTLSIGTEVHASIDFIDTVDENIGLTDTFSGVIS